MEFNKKLQKLRASENLTQEELAEKLYVSRTAISKWESGRGYPSIDSLKAIAEFFHITIDELIGGAEIITLAEQDRKESSQKYTALICGILDCLYILLFLLPVFGNGGGTNVSSVALLSVTEIGTWVKIVFIAVTALTVVNGFCTIVISNFDRSVWNKHRIVTGIVLSIVGTAIFILARQPYAGVFCLFLLLIKGFLILKRK
ncbi:MAG: helix-turn-helix transcriptional regulator [Oscillospiraceae bacterium]|nr:helix-turn-helix transcriptional regulator [Oscillospiraceae bacterium]